MTRFFLALGALLFTASPLLAADPDHGHDHNADGEVSHVFEQAGLHVVHPWTRATSGRDALIFMDLENEGDAPITLLGAHAHWAESAEIVGFALENGEERYLPLPSIPVAPGHDLVLRPKEVALRLSGLSEALVKGQHLDLELQTSLGELEIDVMVEAADATNHGHAGHSH
ncbi:MAG: copper chaperone PCu(A)C [Rhodospirillum sp.]|nr:copper chaperone PCu(A)C [Rhodospirillum sp.]MCF8490013.1 copper chaperone PCu(A)C [Rhodospirillum sp.]MCF8498848.1 copper chaperone PCu(A)C [Rhodospirillum sp.]